MYRQDLMRRPVFFVMSSSSLRLSASGVPSEAWRILQVERNLP